MITKFDAYWVGNGYHYPTRFYSKRDIPKQNAGIKSLRLAFRFEVSYVLMNIEGEILMAGGKWMPVNDFYTAQGRIIGPRDLSAADNTAFCGVWRGAVTERIRENLCKSYNQKPLN